LIEKDNEALENRTPVVIESTITNLNRTMGTMLSYEVSKRFGKDGRPDDTIQIKVTGHCGQSFGFTLAKGITMHIAGDTNDYTGKGLPEGKIAVFPQPDVVAAGFKPEGHVVVSNVSCTEQLLENPFSAERLVSGSASETLGNSQLLLSLFLS
jgi:glutamate synthase domain-containing protein 3